MDFNFKKYVYQKRAEGCNDKQIATSLGMSLKHFITKLAEAEGKNPIKELFDKQLTQTILKPKKEKKIEEPKPEAAEES